MLMLRSSVPNRVSGHVLVVVSEPPLPGARFGKKYYLCLRCLRIARHFPLFYQHGCWPCADQRFNRGYLDAESDNISPELAEMIGEEGIRSLFDSL